MCVLRHFDRSDPLQGIAVSFRHMPGQPLASREQRATQCPGVPPFLVLNEEAVREMEEEAWQPREYRGASGAGARRPTRNLPCCRLLRRIGEWSHPRPDPRSRHPSAAIDPVFARDARPPNREALAIRPKAMWQPRPRRLSGRHGAAGSVAAAERQLATKAARAAE